METIDCLQAKKLQRKFSDKVYSAHFPGGYKYGNKNIHCIFPFIAGAGDKELRLMARSHDVKLPGKCDQEAIAV